MGIPVLILGESGTGKSASLRNFKENEVKVINVASKPLPFKNKLESVSVDTYEKILKEIKNTDKPTIVVDDAQYIMANEFMRRASERGYDKFTEIAFHMWDIVNEVKELAADKIVYFLSHLERDSEGNEKVKTIGKLLDEKITLEGMFTIVLKTNVSDGTYSFLTQNSGKDTVKSPIGLFDSYAIDNDLKYVDNKIRNYYELGFYLSDEEVAELDKIAKVEEPQKGRRGRKTDDKPKRSRKEVEEANDHAVATQAQDDPREEVPIDEVETPELEKLPRKTAEEAKTRTRKSRTVEDKPTQDVDNNSESSEGQSDNSDDKPVRRRRRRD